MILAEPGTMSWKHWDTGGLFTVVRTCDSDDGGLKAWMVGLPEVTSVARGSRAWAEPTGKSMLHVGKSLANDRSSPQGFRWATILLPPGSELGV